MKVLKFLSFFCFLATLSIGFVSCGDDDDDENVNLGAGLYESISGKYTVTNASPYQSIELGASGNYIIELNQNQGVRSVASGNQSRYLSFLRGFSNSVSTRAVDDFIYGKYTKEGNILHLENFGTLEIIYQGDIVASFKLTPSNGNPISLQVEKEEQLENDALNNQLCRTWNIISIREADYINGQVIDDDTMTPENPFYTDEDGNLQEVTDFPVQVLFSKAGTYLVYCKDGTINVLNWRWRNKSEKTVNYGSGDYWEDDEWFTISFSGKRMIVIDDSTDTYEGETYRFYNETILEAAN